MNAFYAHYIPICCPFLAKVKANETVLIHAGASGVGTAAVQLVRLCGAIPLVTTGALKS